MSGRAPLAALALVLLFAAALLSGEPQKAAPGPKGFKNLELGKPLEEVKRLLQEEPLFDYRGDPDVSFLPLPAQVLIECRGTTYIERAYFQFHEQRLFIIILSLRRDKLDYYSLFRTLSDKYGIPSSVSPTESVWDFGALRLSLEKPLSVKYVDRGVFESLRERGKADRDLGDLSKKQFLEQF